MSPTARSCCASCASAPSSRRRSRRLGEQALTETDLQKLFDDVVSTIAEILDVEFVKILELVPGDAELLLRAGHRLARRAGRHRA